MSIPICLCDLYRFIKLVWQVNMGGERLGGVAVGCIAGLSK